MNLEAKIGYVLLALLNLAGAVCWIKLYFIGVYRQWWVWPVAAWSLVVTILAIRALLKLYKKQS